MKFTTLFALRVRHDFYAEASCPDFQIEAAPATQSILQSHRCVLKALPDGLRVATAVDERNQPQIRLAAGTPLSFQLRLVNPDFPLFTDLTGISGGAAYFTNQGQSAANGVVSLGTKPERSETTESFVLTAGTKSASFRLSGDPTEGSKESDFVLQGAGGPVSLIGYDQGQKTITVERSGVLSAERSFTVTYPVRPRWPRNVFAKVELMADDAWASAAAVPLEYRIEFKARSAVWRYYLCTNRTLGPGKSFSIGSEEPAFGPARAEPDDPLVKMLEGQNPDFRVWCFDSRAAVPCRETARKGLQLKVGADALIDPLPNPSFRSLCRINQEVAFFAVIQDAAPGVAARKP